MMKKKVPIWLADDANSGVTTYWVPLQEQLGESRVIFISDDAATKDLFKGNTITSDVFKENRKKFHSPILNLGVTRYFCKQLAYLYRNEAFVFFHQLFLQKLIENYYIRFNEKSIGKLEIYGENEGGEVGRLLASIGARGGLEFDEYYLRTFSVNIAKQALGFCSSWSGAGKLLAKEANDDKLLEKFFYLPPNFEHFTNVDMSDSLNEAESGPIRFAIVGHNNPAKQPLFCSELIRSLNRKGINCKLVAIGNIGKAVLDGADAELASYVECIDVPEADDYASAMTSCDFLLHFRKPFGGEMSLVVCEAFALNVPTIAYESDWMLDFDPSLWVGLNPSTTVDEASDKLVDIIVNKTIISKMRNDIKSFVDNENAQNTAVERINDIVELITNHDKK